MSLIMDQSVIKMLLVEDDEDDYIITKDLLQEIGTSDYKLDWEPDFDTARKRIVAQEHDIYLVDFRLGSHNGIELLKEAVAAGCEKPIILLTGMGDHEVDMQAMKLGAADYLVKGQINAPLLQRSIRHSLQRKETERKLRASQEQLRQAQKMESMGTLAGGIAHDFNNILAIISGYANKFKSPSLPEDERIKSADAIEKAVQRGAALVRQILTFARKTDVRLEKVNLNSVIEELARMLKETFPKTINLSLDLQSDISPVIADVSQIHQTVLNLCVNARDAMPQGGTLKLKTGVVPGKTIKAKHADATDQNYIHISIQDSGIGIDEETIQLIFEPFFSTKQKEGGTGLGLSMVYGIVQNHKGFVDVQSARGAGTLFNVYLPQSSTTEGAFLQSAPDHPHNSDSKNANETILFIEDEDLLLDLMQTLLEEKGYRVLTARDGQEGIAMFKQNQNQISLVVTDMGLPTLGGWEVFLQIRQNDPTAKVLLASGYMDPELKSKILKAGARDFVQKPYVPSELFTRIRRALDDEQHAAGDGSPIKEKEVSPDRR
ncbi:MAG: response regulator [Verrucomicrobiales bacterium]